MIHKGLVGIFLAFFLTSGACFIYGEENKGGKNMNLTSSEFKHNDFIPNRFSCEGEDINPPLEITNIPPAAKSLVLIVDDPDAPMGTWVHWVVFDMPVSNLIKVNSIPGKQGMNNAGNLNYHGPCPPSGTHRYYFKIYALDVELNLKEGISKVQLEKAMLGHILEKAELIGLYKRK